MKQMALNRYKYKFVLWKKYFDTGYGFTSFVKYFLAIFGIANLVTDRDYVYILFFGFIYAVICFIVGWGWFKYQFAECDAEVMNRINPFVHEVRNELKNGKVFK